MADNIGYTPGTGATVAADDIGGVLFQRIKPTWGEDGAATDVSAAAPLPVATLRAEDLLVMLSRIVKLLESGAVVDQQQRQRVTLDAITTNLTLGTVSTVGTVTTVSGVTTVSSVTNVAANAGMDREQYINVAKQTYANSIRARLEFV